MRLPQADWRRALCLLALWLCAGPLWVAPAQAQLFGFAGNKELALLPICACVWCRHSASATQPASLKV